MRARVGGASVMYLPRGCFRYERPWLKDEGRRTPKPPYLKAEATQRTLVCKRGWGLCEGGIRRNEDEPELGEGCVLPPNKSRPEAPAPQGGEQGKGGTEESRPS